jgi:UDP-N-acetylmuramate: L-alanyl-gamma-D-glutamyl-meso-diaminopimelate ligase
MKRVHFIAIGGAAMHNLAIALHHKGYMTTGSDDEIFEPSKSRLQRLGLLPEKEGWNADKITTDIDVVVLGMHAKKENPELLRAKELGLTILSYPEFLYEAAKDKARIVIGGSHGKTTITAMILHVFKDAGIDFDYMVGAQLDGFEVMTRISDAPVMVFEGDEYLTSALDRRPKFHLYHPHIALISGIAWDHINVFPTFENYVEQFHAFADLIEPNGTLIYCNEDQEVEKIARNARPDINRIPYGIADHFIKDGITYLRSGNENIPLMIFGKHNLMNLEGARAVCNSYGISNETFYQSIQTFIGASNRLELVAKNDDTVVYKDFAHSASKLKATVSALKNQYPDRDLVACMELHTYSSLSEKFLPQYKNSMADANIAFVYFNPHAIMLKKLPEISVEQVAQGFGTKNVRVFTDSNLLWDEIEKINFKGKNLLMMSSGNFDGKDIKELGKKLTK